MKSLSLECFLESGIEWSKAIYVGCLFVNSAVSARHV